MFHFTNGVLLPFCPCSSLPFLWLGILYHSKKIKSKQLHQKHNFLGNMQDKHKKPKKKILDITFKMIAGNILSALRAFFTTPPPPIQLDVL